MLPKSRGKIPGELPKAKTNDYVQDLNKLNKPELKELRDRQMKLLSNKSRISKLPDKGQRIQDFYSKIQNQLGLLDDIEVTANKFSDLNIAKTGIDKITNLEWTGKSEEKDVDIVLDSDDEEDTYNPLKIIAQSRNVEKKVKLIKADKSLITEDDLSEIKNFHKDQRIEQIASAEVLDIKSNLHKKLNEPLSRSRHSSTSSLVSGESASSSTNLELDPHILYLYEKGGIKNNKKEKFLPFKTTKSNVHDPEKEQLRKHAENWENTAATPPHILHAGTKMLTLEDSVRMQVDYLYRLEELQKKQAEERLAERAARMKSSGLTPPNAEDLKVYSFFTGYRDTVEIESDNDNEINFESDEGVRDDEDEKVGGVVYTVYE